MEDLKFKTAAQVMKHSNTEGRDADFYTNMNKGFAMAINGYRISVQWGPGNYVDREIRNNDYDAPMQHSIWGCDTAEVMIWGRDGDCLFEALVYFIRRVGAKGLHTLPGYPTEAWTIVEEILDLVGRYGKDNEEGLNLQIAIMRDYLAKSVKKDWTKEQPSLNENPYMTFLDESAGGAGIFKDSDDYLTHMTSKNEDDAKYIYKKTGIKNFLIGESLLKSDNTAELMKRFIQIIQ